MQTTDKPPTAADLLRKHRQVETRAAKEGKPLNTEERRFVLWSAIHELNGRFPVEEIASVTKQAPNVIEYVLEGVPLNRIRCIAVLGLKPDPIPDGWRNRPTRNRLTGWMPAIERPGLPVNADGNGTIDVAVEAPQPRANGVVDVMAVDFMNLFVRAWHTGKASDTHGIRSMFQTVAKAARFLQPKRIVFCMEGGYTKRSNLYPAYKAHRKPSPDGLIQQRQLAKDILAMAGFPMLRFEDWEADDVLASIACQIPDSVLLTSDKDLLTYHGRCRIYHPWGDGQFVDSESLLGLKRQHVADYLALNGDESDGIPGVSGCGPKTAKKLLERFDSLEAILMAAQQSQIAGTIGQALRNDPRQALLSADLVALNEGLPVPEFAPWQYPADADHKISSAGAANVAAVLGAMAKTMNAEATGASKPESTPTIESESIKSTKYRKKTVSARQWSDGRRELVVVAPLGSPGVGDVIRREYAEPPSYFDSVFDQLSEGNSNA